MKKISIIFISMAFAFFAEAQQTDFSWIKSGLKLRYYLHEYNSNYEFMVELLDIKESKLFNWWMTWPVNRIGSCEITAEAMKTATTQQNYFSGGHEVFDNRTTGYVSYAVWKAMKNKDTIVIQPNGYDEKLVFKKDVLYEITIDGKKTNVPTMYCETNLGSKFWLLDNPNDPIILKMVIGFNIEIGEIMTPEYWDN